MHNFITSDNVARSFTNLSVNWLRMTFEGNEIAKVKWERKQSSIELNMKHIAMLALPIDVYIHSP